MSLTRQILQIKSRIENGENVDMLLENAAANIEEYAKEPSFFTLPFETIEIVVSKRAGKIPFETAEEILNGTSHKYGKRTISLLQFINCGKIGYSKACTLVRCISECPIIDELLKGHQNENVTTPKFYSFNSRARTPQRPKHVKESEGIMQSDDINALKRANANIIDELEDFIDQIESDGCPKRGCLTPPPVKRVVSPRVIRIPKSPGLKMQSENDIFQAIVDNNIEAVKRIINNDRSEVNRRNPDNNYPIHVAAKKGRLDIINLLVDYGADVNQKGYSFLTAMHFAADFNYPDIIKYLLNKGANIEAKSGWIPSLFFF